jgi:hypothetical protein
MLHVSNRQKAAGVLVGRSDAETFELHLSIAQEDIDSRGLKAVANRWLAEADGHRARRPVF